MVAESLSTKKDSSLFIKFINTFYVYKGRYLKVFKHQKFNSFLLRELFLHIQVEILNRFRWIHKKGDNCCQKSYGLLTVL